MSPPGAAPLTAATYQLTATMAATALPAPSHTAASRRRCVRASSTTSSSALSVSEVRASGARFELGGLVTPEAATNASASCVRIGTGEPLRRRVNTPMATLTRPSGDNVLGMHT